MTKTWQILLLSVALAAAVLAGWFLLQSDEDTNPIDLLGPVATAPLWSVAAGSPLRIGDLEDPFAYAGGERVRLLEGEAQILIGRDASSGSFEASVALDGTAAVLAESIDPTVTLELRGTLGTETLHSIGTSIHGETGLGDPRLPMTHALLSGETEMELVIDGTERGAVYRTFWSVASGLRREDGAIRNQGLVFSPLLRDDTVFADPDRLELTLLVYRSGDAPQTDSVVLHLVYMDIDVLAAPEGAPIPKNESIDD